MNKSDIVGRVAGRMGMSRAAAERAVDTVLEAIAEALAREEPVRLAGFGTFTTKSRAARTGRNPRTGEAVAIPASKAPSFKAGQALRDAVNKGWDPVSSGRADDRNMEHLAQGEDGKTLDVSDTRVTRCCRGQSDHDRIIDRPARGRAAGAPGGPQR